MANERIEIVVFDGFDELDVFGPFEVLSSAGFQVCLVTVEEPGSVVSMRGVEVGVPAVLGAADRVVVPGGGWLNRAAEGSWAQAQRGVLPDRLGKVARSARWMASVCTGSMLLAKAGLLTGRYATTNRNAFDELAPHVLQVIDERVVDDNDRITAGGLTAGLDLGLWIAERELGPQVADRVARSIEYAPQGRVWHAPRRNGTVEY
ncbi:DJ-1/PfpI family protein [Actinomadura montaniterrae]|uniref:DJ-1/PfpI family protein n=1 Tax=Actinomadura montaniterrae TaxID=1803903 RepID=A0A6L3VQU0_9ACTN|nr:DJ-1/PfpI family protein [Actinomadura montaniterrae]KAB2378972.1 DJ-1/PfpI family protein [Actinomadura montaniterrae]